MKPYNAEYFAGNFKETQTKKQRSVSPTGLFLWMGVRKYGHWLQMTGGHTSQLNYNGKSFRGLCKQSLVTDGLSSEVVAKAGFTVFSNTLGTGDVTCLV